MGLVDRLFRRRSDRPDPKAILATLHDFITSPAWAQFGRLLEEHPELLSEPPTPGRDHCRLGCLCAPPRLGQHAATSRIDGSRSMADLFQELCSQLLDRSLRRA